MVSTWTVARQASLCMGFSKQEYWGGSPCPCAKGFRNPEDKEAHLALEESGKVMRSCAEDAVSQHILRKDVPGRGNSVNKVGKMCLENCLWFMLLRWVRGRAGVGEMGSGEVSLRNPLLGS